MVIGIETGGRWSDEAAEVVRTRLRTGAMFLLTSRGCFPRLAPLPSPRLDGTRGAARLGLPHWWGATSFVRSARGSLGLGLMVFDGL